MERRVDVQPLCCISLHPSLRTFTLTAQPSYRWKWMRAQIKKGERESLAHSETGDRRRRRASNSGREVEEEEEEKREDAAGATETLRCALHPRKRDPREGRRQQRLKQQRQQQRQRERVQAEGGRDERHSCEGRCTKKIDGDSGVRSPETAFPSSR